jgi:group I intron endonuclease
MVGIYKIISPEGCVYIGQSIDIERRRKAYSKVKNYGQPKLKRSFKKYGFKNHTFEIIEECAVKQLDEKEIFYKQQIIEELGWNKALFCQLIDGKGGNKSTETKHKMSLYASNRTQEHNLKISQKLKGHKQTPQHCLNKSKAMKGKKVRCKNVLQHDLQGNFIKEWLSAKEACLFYNPKDLNGVSACCLGRQKTAFGYIWKYKEN